MARDSARNDRWLGVKSIKRLSVVSLSIWKIRQLEAEQQELEEENKRLKLKHEPVKAETVNLQSGFINRF